MAFPTLLRDYLIVGGPYIGSTISLVTWGQARTAVTCGPHFDGIDGTFGDTGMRAMDYFAPVYGINAVDTEGRIFRGIPYSVIGYADYFDALNNYRFFFGALPTDPSTGLQFPLIFAGLDEEEIQTILQGALVIGSINIVTTGPSFDGTDPEGQAIGGVPLGTVASISLSF
jgi:hypothetical protein